MLDPKELDYEYMWKKLKYQVELCEAKDLREIPVFVVRAFMEFIEDLAKKKEDEHGS